MPRVGRKASSLFLFGMLVTMALVTSFGTVVAQDQGAGNDTATDGGGAGAGNDTAGDDGDATNGTAGADDPATGGGPLLSGAEGIQRIHTVAAVEADGTFAWDITALVVKPGDQVTLIADLSTAAAPHNLHLGPSVTEDAPFDVVYTPDGSTRAVKKTADIAGKGEVSASFTVPEDFESVSYWCTIHPTMRGTLSTQAVGGAGEPIHHLGVHFLAYWVGVIAFALLFVVYGITFFLFKYNETSATTDQWDRTGAGAPDVKNTMSSGRATLLAIVIGIVALAAIVYVARIG